MEKEPHHHPQNASQTHYTGPLDLDKTIDKLISGSTLPQSDLEELLHAAKEMLRSESSLIEIKAPITVVGDIHGEISTLQEIFNVCGKPPFTNFLFLGDYINRGNHGIEVLCTLLAYKLKHRNRIHLLRGHSECRDWAKKFGFHDECIRKYDGHHIWQLFIELFPCFPLAAVISGEIFAVHSGLSIKLPTLDSIRQIDRFNSSLVEVSSPISDLLMCTPADDITGYSTRHHTQPMQFGPDVTSDFLKNNGLKTLIRSSKVVEEGCARNHDGVVWTVFSAPNYCGRCKNKGAVLEITDSGEISSIEIDEVAKREGSPQLVSRMPGLDG